MKNILYLLCLMAVSFLTAGCSDDDSPQPEPEIKNDKKEILTFQFLLNENPISTHVIGDIDEEMHTVFAILPGNALKTALLPKITLSSGATISPEGVQNFSNPVTYTVMAEDSTQQTYEVTVVTEKEALVAIYEASPSNRLDWDLDDQNLSNWEGVTLNNGVIVDLLIHNSGLTTIPSEIGYLRNLVALGIHINDFPSLPPAIGDLVHLEQLSVGSNGNLHSIPPEIGQLERLKVFHLDNNPLLMSIPKEIGQLTTLTNLYINGNGFTIIPSEVCELETVYDTDIFKGTGVTCD